MMDANPSVSLSFLYKNDQFYALCAADLMTASQAVNNSFINEQRKLVSTLKRLEYQKLIKMRQINEEKRQFDLLMKRKLAPQVCRVSSLTPHSGRARSANMSISAFSASKSSSVKSFKSEPTSEMMPDILPSTPPSEEVLDVKRKLLKASLKVSQAYFKTTVPKTMCKCGYSQKQLTQSESCLPTI
ncbi:uncharacterized protein LOC122799471 isoform X2 [Protopterus annectens]|nr:uncharacterized protein LOC122799471 isoform X2 [Protopterus annectens]XP_043924485.1 uncharacterized protein LOC122799471 isoform X2 [Protopterus annectens]